MHPFLTFAIVVSFLYMCLVVGTVLYDWSTGWKLLDEPQSPDESGD